MEHILRRIAGKIRMLNPVTGRIEDVAVDFDKKLPRHPHIWADAGLINVIEKVEGVHLVNAFETWYSVVVDGRYAPEVVIENIKQAIREATHDERG